LYCAQNFFHTKERGFRRERRDPRVINQILNFQLPSNSALSTFISSDFAYAKKPTISWHGMLLGPTRKKPEQVHNKLTAYVNK